jgi:hypothetical protein
MDMRYYRDKKVVGVFVRFRAPLALYAFARLMSPRTCADAKGRKWEMQTLPTKPIFTDQHADCRFGEAFSFFIALGCKRCSRSAITSNPARLYYCQGLPHDLQVALRRPWHLTCVA